MLRRFQSGPAALPKHVRLHDAFVDAIGAGELSAGTRVLAERDLSRALGLSLGTTQKALARLAASGYLVRRQGDGTFVGSHRRAIAGTWHARFADHRTGEEMPVYSTILDRQRSGGDEACKRALGDDPDGYVHVVRALHVGGAFTCANHVYLPARRFARLLRMAAQRLADVNLKQVLAEQFSAPTLRSDGLARLAVAGASDARIMAIPPLAPVLAVDITAYSFGREPITYQRLLVPATDHAMKLDFNPPDEDGAAPRP
jgi:DNA-binding GntR family transcriptional regulator